MDAAERATYEAEHEAAVRVLCPIDLGDGIHRAGWDEQEGHPRNLFWAHRCRDDHYSLGMIDVTSGQRHTLISEDPLNIGGSLLCLIVDTHHGPNGCGEHGFIRDGRWIPA